MMFHVKQMIAGKQRVKSSAQKDLFEPILIGFSPN